MGNLNKTLALLLVLLIAFSIVGFLTVEPVNAQVTQKPSAPKVTAKYADYSQYVPTTYGIDAYTGETKVVSLGYTRANRTVQFTIENQPFNQYDENGNQVQLYYYIRYKGNYQSTWDSAQGYYPKYLAEHDGLEEDLLFTASDSAYTNAVLYDPSVYGTEDERASFHFAYLPDAGKIDFQIQALIGTATLQSNGLTGTCLGFYYWTFSGQKSDWSEIITISIPDGAITTTSNQYSTSQTQNPTATPTAPEISTLMILPLLLSMLTVAIIVRKQKTVSTTR